MKALVRLVLLLIILRFGIEVVALAVVERLMRVMLRQYHKEGEIIPQMVFVLVLVEIQAPTKRQRILTGLMVELVFLVQTEVLMQEELCLQFVKEALQLSWVAL
jgi:hypothetical protein